MSTIANELRSKIIKTLELVDITEADIKDDTPFVGDELGLDSIDILELVIMLEKDYGILIDSKELGFEVFQSIASLAAYVEKHKT
jgi:acyl carrier protein